MDPVIEVDISPLKKKFQHACRWIVCGSILFESAKVFHNYFLIRYLNNQAYFGIIGSLFSMIYLTARIIDLGAANSTPPYFAQFSKSKQNFKKLLFFYFFLPSIPFAIIAPFITLHVFTTKFPHTHLFLFMIPMLIVLEAIRSFFRLFLHLTGKTAKVVGFELFAVSVFFSLIWGPLLIFKVKPTLNQLFLPFLVDTIISVIYMSILVYQFYKTLPDDQSTIRITMWKKLSQIRGLNFMLRAGRDIFTSNLLTPLFAVKCGLPQAGLFYFANQLARLLQEVLKGPLIYPGNALLASLKEGPMHHKKAAFAELTLKLSALLAPIVIYLLINYRALARLAKDNSATGLTINFTLLLLLITTSESCFIVYEQFYIIEEATAKLFIFKLIDFSLFYILIFSQTTLQPISALTSIIAIRALSFTLIAINAYFTWRIIPNIKIGWLYAINWTAIAAVSAYLIPKITLFFRY